jgi:hypothetical protein
MESAALKIEPTPEVVEIPLVQDIQVNPVTGDYLLQPPPNFPFDLHSHVGTPGPLPINSGLDTTPIYHANPYGNMFPGGSIMFNTPLEAQVLALTNPVLWSHISPDFNRYNFSISPPVMTGTNIPVESNFIPYNMPLTFKIQAQITDPTPLAFGYSSPVTADINGQRIDGYITNYEISQDMTGIHTLDVTIQVYDTYPQMAVIEQKAYMVKDFIKRQLQGIRQRRSMGLTLQASAEELKARETLRDMLTEAEWRRYVTNGFLMIKGQSGKWYQIFSSRSERIRVFEKGIQTKVLCIHSSNECPATDHVINMKILAEIDEPSLWKSANQYEPTKKPVVQTTDWHEAQFNAELGDTSKVYVPLKNNLVEMVRQTFKVVA